MLLFQARMHLIDQKAFLILQYIYISTKYCLCPQNIKLHNHL